MRGYTDLPVSWTTEPGHFYSLLSLPTVLVNRFTDIVSQPTPVDKIFAKQTCAFCDSLTNSSRTAIVKVSVPRLNRIDPPGGTGSLQTPPQHPTVSDNIFTLIIANITDSNPWPFECIYHDALRCSVPHSPVPPPKQIVPLHNLKVFDIGMGSSLLSRWCILNCQEIGLVAFMFFFELFFSLCSSQFPSMFSLTNLLSIILFLTC